MGAIDNLWGLWQEIARRLNISLEEFVEMRIEEVVHCLKHEKITDDLKNELLKRQRGSALVWDEDGTRLLVGDSLFTYKQLEEEEERFYHIKKIKGQSASPGKVVGRVKILTDIQNIDKVQQGDVLVAIYTYPAIVVAMEKAAAIITDQGGLLSHAAIISRELRKPCIVGTKIATKTFKDGDMVEVDAEKGIVRKISNKPVIHNRDSVIHNRKSILSTLL